MAKRFRRSSREVDDLVVGTIRKAPRGLTAYELMADLAERHQRLAPTQTYRSLGRLIDRGEVGRIESLNCYYSLNGSAAETIILFCRSCRRAVEVECPTIRKDLRAIAQKSGSRLLRVIAEIGGVCPSCQSARSGGER